MSIYVALWTGGTKALGVVLCFFVLLKHPPFAPALCLFLRTYWCMTSIRTICIWIYAPFYCAVAFISSVFDVISDVKPGQEELNNSSSAVPGNPSFRTGSTCPVYLSIHLFICQAALVCLLVSVCLSLCLSVCLSVTHLLVCVGSSLCVWLSALCGFCWCCFLIVMCVFHKSYYARYKMPFWFLYGTLALFAVLFCLDRCFKWGTCGRVEYYFHLMSEAWTLRLVGWSTDIGRDTFGAEGFVVGFLCIIWV